MTSRDARGTGSWHGGEQLLAHPLPFPSHSQSYARNPLHEAQNFSDPIATFPRSWPAQGEESDSAQCPSDISMEDGNDGGPSKPPPAQLSEGSKSSRLFTGKLEKMIREEPEYIQRVDGDSILIPNTTKFVEHALRKHFPNIKTESFEHDLRTEGYRKHRGKRGAEESLWIPKKARQPDNPAQQDAMQEQSQPSGQLNLEAKVDRIQEGLDEVKSVLAEVLGEMKGQSKTTNTLLQEIFRLAAPASNVNGSLNSMADQSIPQTAWAAGYGSIPGPSPLGPQATVFGAENPQGAPFDIGIEIFNNPVGPPFSTGQSSHPEPSAHGFGAIPAINQDYPGGRTSPGGPSQQTEFGGAGLNYPPSQLTISRTHPFLFTRSSSAAPTSPLVNDPQFHPPGAPFGDAFSQSRALNVVSFGNDPGQQRREWEGFLLDMQEEGWMDGEAANIDKTELNLGGLDMSALGGNDLDGSVYANASANPRPFAPRSPIQPSRQRSSFGIDRLHAHPLLEDGPSLIPPSLPYNPDPPPAHRRAAPNPAMPTSRTTPAGLGSTRDCNRLANASSSGNGSYFGAVEVGSGSSSLDMSLPSRRQNENRQDIPVYRPAVFGVPAAKKSQKQSAPAATELLASTPTVSAFPQPGVPVWSSRSASSTAPANAVESEQTFATTSSMAPKTAWSNVGEEKLFSLRKIQGTKAKKTAEAKNALAATVASPASVVHATSSRGLSQGYRGVTFSASSLAPSTGPAGGVWANKSSQASKKSTREVNEGEDAAARVQAAFVASAPAAAAVQVAKGGYADRAQPTSGVTSSHSTIRTSGKSIPPETPAMALTAAVTARRNPLGSRPSTVSIPGNPAPSFSSAKLADKTPPPRPKFIRWIRRTLRADVAGANETNVESARASSSTLDGRRFASEFIAERKTDAANAEAQDAQQAVGWGGQVSFAEDFRGRVEHEGGQEEQERLQWPVWS